MGRPKTYTFELGDGTRASARFIKHTKLALEDGLVCVDCAPYASDVKAIMDNVQFGFVGFDLITTIFQCKRCEAYYAVR